MLSRGDCPSSPPPKALRQEGRAQGEIFAGILSQRTDTNSYQRDSTPLEFPSSPSPPFVQQSQRHSLIGRPGVAQVHTSSSATPSTSYHDFHCLTPAAQSHGTHRTPAQSTTPAQSGWAVEIWDDLMKDCGDVIQLLERMMTIVSKFNFGSDY